jgi:hypothetical protein
MGSHIPEVEPDLGRGSISINTPRTGSTSISPSITHDLDSDKICGLSHSYKLSTGVGVVLWLNYLSDAKASASGRSTASTKCFEPCEMEGIMDPHAQ